MDELDKRDAELGRALERALSGGNDAEFVNRVVAAADAAGMLAPTEWWEVLGQWARPGLIAVAAIVVLMIGASLVGPRSQPDVAGPAEGLIVTDEVAELAEPVPPDPETMMATAFTRYRP